MSKIKVNEELCIGCGTCEALCPDVFKVENGKSKVIAESCEKCTPDEMTGNCPVGAISIEE